MTKQIDSFGMARMSVGACCNFHVKTIQYITDATPAALHIEGKMPGYTSVVTTLSSLVNRQRAYISTGAMKETDLRRDHALGVINNVVCDYQTTPVAEKQAAAKLLYPQLSPYRGIRDHEYNKQTSEIRGMLSLLDQEQNKAAITTLGLNEELEALREANAAFDAIYDQRVDEASVRKELNKIKTSDVIEQANALYLDIVLTVNAYAVIQPTDEINAFIDKMNGLVKSLADASGSSTSSGSEPKPKPDEPEPVTPEITAVYQKEGGDPENPHRIGRDEQTMVEYQGFTLKGQDGTLDHVVALINDQDYPEWIKPATITNVTENSFEFTMVPDLTEGQYKVRIETYDGGSPLVVEYPEPITLW